MLLPLLKETRLRTAPEVLVASCCFDGLRLVGKPCGFFQDLTTVAGSCMVTASQEDVTAAAGSCVVSACLD